VLSLRYCGERATLRPSPPPPPLPSPLPSPLPPPPSSATLACSFIPFPWRAPRRKTRECLPLWQAPPCVLIMNAWRRTRPSAQLSRLREPEKLTVESDEESRRRGSRSHAMRCDEKHTRAVSFPIILFRGNHALAIKGTSGRRYVFRKLSCLGKRVVVSFQPRTWYVSAIYLRGI